MGKSKRIKSTRPEENPVKERKHLFGSTEKSDFILNMTPDGAEKMCGRFLILAMLIVTAVVIPAYFTQSIVTYTIQGTPHLLSDNFIFYGAALLMLAGFIGFLIYSITCSKGIASVRGNKELYVAFAVMVVSTVSALTAGSISTSVLGYLGRHEGLLTICALYGMFGVALCVGKSGLRGTVCDFIVGIGVFQSIVGFLQCIPATSGFMDNFYEYLYLRAGSIAENSGEVYYEGGYAYTTGIYTHTRAATGFVLTPFGLAALLTVCFAVAVAGAAFAEKKKRRTLYSVGAVVIAAAACLTRTTAGVVGIAAAGAVVTVLALFGIRKDGKSALPGLISVVLSGVCAVTIFMTGASDIRDEQIIFTEGYVHRSISYDRRLYSGTGESIFTYLAKDGLNIITQKPILGVGPDNPLYEFDKYSLTTDRFYNEYVDAAATRGVIAEGLHIVFLLLCFAKLIRAMRDWRRGEGSWVSAAAFAGVLAFLIQAWFNTSWYNSGYFMYILLGLGCTVVIPEEKPEK